MWLIRKWLRAPIQINGKLRKRRKGMPQGSPLSPLLSNILLNELDQTLHGMQLRFVRYADDFSIYVKSKTEARRIHQWVINYLKTQLKLPVNTEKAEPEDRFSSGCWVLVLCPTTAPAPKADTNW